MNKFIPYPKRKNRKKKRSIMCALNKKTLTKQRNCMFTNDIETNIICALKKKKLKLNEERD